MFKLVDSCRSIAIFCLSHRALRSLHIGIIHLNIIYFDFWHSYTLTRNLFTRILLLSLFCWNLYDWRLLVGPLSRLGRRLLGSLVGLVGRLRLGRSDWAAVSALGSYLAQLRWFIVLLSKVHLWYLRLILGNIVLHNNNIYMIKTFFTFS